MMLHRARILAWLMWDAPSFFEWLTKRPWYIQILTDWGAAIPIEPGDHGLEVGCGPGLLAGQLHEQGVKMRGRVSVLFPTPRLSDDAAGIARRRGLEGLSAAALETWGSKAPKREAEAIEALFEGAGLLDIRVDWFFDDSIASVTGRVA